MSITSMAYDFVVDGIYYNIRSYYYDSNGYHSGSCVYVAPMFSNQTSNAAAYKDEVTVPSSVEYDGVTYPVTGVDSYAFKYCSTVTKVVLPESVTCIESYAFYECTTLESVSMPGEIRFYDGTFQGCSSLKSVTIAEGTKSLSRYMFEGCSKLAEVNLPSTLTSIGDYAFENCDALTSIELPDNVSSIGSYCFYSCDNLQTVKLSSKLTSIPENAFGYCYALKTITLPEGVISLGNSAFRYCSSLESINFPEGMTTIAGSAFSGCSKLLQVDLPKSLIYIGESVFNNCTSLAAFTVADGNTKYATTDGLLLTADKTEIILVPQGISGEVTIPVGITTISNNAFYNCQKLSSISIPSTVVSIGNSAFSGCSSLESANIAEGVSSIGDETFCNCQKLSSISIPSTVVSIGNYAFRSCSSLESANIAEGVSSIGNYAFRDCSSLSSISLPSTVETIGVYAFYNCSSLESANIAEGVSSIGNYAFRDCSSLSSISIPSTVVSIGNYAFSGCSSLESANIAEGVSSIGNDAFYSCSKLSSISIPSTVVTIGSNAFNYCWKTTTINYGGTLAQWCGIKFGNNNATPIGANPDATLKIGGEEVESALVIPAGVTEIGQYAFYSNRAITSVTIPSSVTKIGAGAFNASGLEKIVVNGSTPASVSGDAFTVTSLFFVGNSDVDTYKSAWTSFANRIFPQTSLETVANTSVTDGKSALLNAIGGVGNEANIISLKVNGTINGYDIMLMRNKLTNLRYLDLSDATIVPEKDNYQYYTGYYTKENVLGAYSFYDVDNLRSVVLPKNITEIEPRAFSACDNLTEVTGMPECCTTIGYYAFSDSKLSKIEIGTGVTSIDRYAFSYCRNLKTINIPASVKTINYDAFRDCNALETVNFAEGLETIGSNAFYGCSKLNELRLPSSLKTINSYAFYNCSSLEQIHIPSMLTSIGDNAFTGCTKAKDVYSYTLSPINILQNTFIYDGVTLHAPQVPDEVFWDYYTNTQWSQFTNVVPFEAKYETWYLGEDKDIVLGNDETIPNEDGEQAEGTMQPGSGLVYEEGSYQWLDKLNLKWKDGKAPSLLDNGDMYVDELVFTLDVQANKWYFFCFPFDIDLSNAKYQGRFVWRYYDGDERASHGEGAWKNVMANEQGKMILHAYQGYIFQTNKAGEVELTVIDPIFTAKDKQVTIASHPSENAQDAGWNLVGNPNISYYDLSNFLNNYGKPITVWDPVNNTYTAVMPGDDDYEFHPFEAFFVQKPMDIEKITFDNDARETYNQSQENAQAKARARASRQINPDRLIVNLAISNGTVEDKTRVVFNDAKALGYDEECDASKFVSADAAVQIYTVDNNVKYAINERPNKDNTVKIGYTATAVGAYTISAMRMDCAMAVKDMLTGAIHNFSEGDYEFLTEAGTFEDRFVLIPETGTTGINSLQSAGIVVEAVNGGINLGGLNGQTATVYGVNGAMVTVIGNEGHADVPAGAYIVKVGEKSSKVVVK